MTVSVAPQLLLNVDDNEVGRYAKSRILRQAGFEVIDAATGMEAIRLAGERTPELVLLDVKLPDINGIDVCRIIKRDHPDILVLQISASFITDVDKVRGLECGADSYLTQPVAPNELIASVRALLRIRSAERALRQSEAHLQGVLASATDYAIIRIGETGLITGWNSGAVGVFGLAEAEALGQDVRILFTDEDQAAGIPAKEISDVRSAGKADDKRFMKRKDGSKFYAAGVMTRLSAPAEPGFLKILSDQTQQYEAETALQELNSTLDKRVKARTRELEAINGLLREQMEVRERAEEQLRHSQKMDALGQLTGGIAHDFNNMLAVVMAGLGLIERRLARGDTDVRKYTQGVMESARRAAGLTQRLLAFSRQQPLSPEPLDANGLVGKLSELLGRTLGEAIKFETVLASGLWKVKADPSQLESALVNLAVNARDAMNESGHLTIETRNAQIDGHYAKEHQISPGQYVLLAVSDTGSGMSADVRSKAFDPFFTTKGVGKGTGLGLSQVFGFVRQSGGHVEIDSEVGVGSTVKIYLPRYEGDEEVNARENHASAFVARSNEVILLVEDEARVRLMAVDALSELGYSVIVSESGVEALQLLRAGQKVDLLFTDVVMPDMTGRELADHASKLIPGLKVLFTTGYARNTIARGNLLQKPFCLDELAAKVRSVLDENDA